MLHLPLFVIVTRAFHAIYRLFTSSHPRPPQPCQAPSWMALKERPVGVVGLTSGIKSTTYLMYLGAGMVCSRSLAHGYVRLSTYLRELSIRAYHLSFLTTSEQSHEVPSSSTHLPRLVRIGRE